MIDNNGYIFVTSDGVEKTARTRQDAIVYFVRRTADALDGWRRFQAFPLTLDRYDQVNRAANTPSNENF